MISIRFLISAILIATILIMSVEIGAANEVTLTLEGITTDALPNNAMDVCVTGNHAYVADYTNGLVIVDISDPANPTTVGNFPSRIGDYGYTAAAIGVAVSGNYAYVANWYDDLYIIDITDKTNPTLANTYTIDDGADSITISGDLAFIAAAFAGVDIIDISDPVNPVFLGNYNTNDLAEDIAIQNNYAYIADRDDGVIIVDVSDPANPSFVGSCDTPYDANSIVVSGAYAYVADADDTLIIDISNPATPAIIGQYDTGDAWGIALDGNYVYVGDGDNGVVVLNVIDPTNPVLAGGYSNGGYAGSIDIIGDLVYVADGPLVILRTDASSTSGPVHNINKGTDYPTIQAAIDDASPGDEIQVDSGTYYENVVVNKQLILQGESNLNTIIDGNSGDFVVEVIANEVVIEGFKIQNGIYGIYITSSNNTLISNTVSSYMYGVLLQSSNNNTLIGNTASNNNYGISLQSSNNNTLIGNTVSNNINGISLQSSNNNTLTGNTVSDNNDGITLDYSSNNTLSNNIFINDGLIVELSYKNNIVENTVNNKPLVYFENKSDIVIQSAGQVILVNSNNITVEGLKLSNTSPGIELWNTRDCTIISNIVSNNEIGIILGYSNNNTLSGNTVSNNEFGIWLYFSNSNNILHHNNLVDNQYNALDDDVNNQWDWGTTGNYYSDYTGTDSNGDGIGDTPYPIPGGSSVDNYPLMAPYFPPVYDYEGKLLKQTGDFKVYLIEDGKKRHFASPEALEWNGHSFDDVTEVSVDVMNSFEAGADISITQAIIDKHNALGGATTFGTPAGTGEQTGYPDNAGVICTYVNFQNGAIEYFTNGDQIGNAYAILNPFFDKWASMGYGKSVLGYPISDMSDPQTSSLGTPFKYQNFINGTESGALEYNLSSGEVFEIHGAIYATWSAMGYANGILGLVTSDERNAVPSFKGTTGRVSDFENGHLHWHSSGDHYMVTYMTYGDLDELYVSMGGTASWLGFPVMHQEDRSGYGYCEFEGGYIEWDGSEYKALPTTGHVHNINKGTHYTTIQAAIDDASPGDEIHVDSGTYYENVVINKQLILRGIGTGTGMPVVDAGGSGNVVTISADGCILNGFIITNSGLLDVNAGIIITSNDNVIKNNEVSSNKAGISLESSNNNAIEGNIVNFNSYPGIALTSSNDNIISHNEVNSNVYYGIELYLSSNNTVIGNIANSNTRYGIFVWKSDTDNRLISNTANTNDYAGIRFHTSSNNEVSGNLVVSNIEYGISMYGSNGNIISENNASFSKNGIYLDSSSNNMIYHNNIIKNTNQAFDNLGPNTWDNGYPSGGNYWSDYIEVDIKSGPNQDQSGSDGIGDTPYPIPGGSSVDRYPLMNPWTAAPLSGKIAFASSRDGNQEVYVMNANGSGDPINLTNHPDADDGDPTWSPDGTQIAFSSNRSGNWTTYIMNADGSDQVCLLEDVYDAWGPAWSPDGKKIAVAIKNNFSDDFEIYTVDIQSRAVTWVTDNISKDSHPAWSPDSNKIVFTSDRDDNQEIYVADLLTGIKTRLTENLSNDDYPEWSPDGSMIAFVSERDGNPEIYSMDIASKTITRLTYDDSTDKHAQWSPDGQKIIFISNRSGDMDVYVMKSNGTSTTCLVDWEGEETHPTWSSGHSSPPAYSVGEGAPTPAIEQLFIDAYNRNGGVGVLGDPTTEVHDAWGYLVQDFPGVPGIPGGVIMYNDIKDDAFYIHGAIWERYYTFVDKSELGPVASDEGEAAILPQGTTGRYTKFETGTIHWISDKDDENVGHPQRGESFVTYGELDALYTSMGGTYSDLGFPVMDQMEKDGHGYCEFEGGIIEWDEEQNKYFVRDYVIDLNITDIWFEKENPVEGEPITITTEIKNVGEVDVSDFWVRFDQSSHYTDFEPEEIGANAIIGDVFIETLASGESKEIQMPWNAAPVKTDREGSIRIFVDSRESINEGTNENNNIKYGKITITSRSRFKSEVDSYHFNNFKYTKEELDNYLPDALGTIEFPSIYLQDIFISTVNLLFGRDGNCYGMSATSAIYYKGGQKPVDTDTFEMMKNNINVKRYIFDSQIMQIFASVGLHITNPNPTLKEEYYNWIKPNIDNDQPVLLWISLDNGGHSVLAYNIYEVSETIKNVVVYDSNYPGMGRVIQFDLEHNNVNYLVMDQENHIFKVGLQQTQYPIMGFSYPQKNVINSIKDLFKNLASDGKKLISIFCPVNVMIIDEYGRAISDTGINEIPDATYINIGDIKLFLIPDDLDYTVNINAYDSGTFSYVEMIPLTNESVSEISFRDIIISEKSKVIIDVDSAISEYIMQIDYDGDGAFDEIREPDSIQILKIYNISFLPPITTMDQFNLTDGSTLPIKFTARDIDTGDFIYDDTVNVTITNSTGHLITYFINGTGTDSVRINTTEEQYIVNFHTRNYALNVGETYAITVTFGEPDSLRGYEITYFTLVDKGKGKEK